jgi:hypothetical protein
VNSAEKRLRSALQAALREIDTPKVVLAVCEEMGLDAVASHYIAAKLRQRFQQRN